MLIRIVFLLIVSCSFSVEGICNTKVMLMVISRSFILSTKSILVNQHLVLKKQNFLILFSWQIVNLFLVVTHVDILSCF